MIPTTRVTATPWVKKNFLTAGRPAAKISLASARALSRQMSIGHFRRRISASALAIHEQKQWGCTRPRAPAGSIEFSLTMPARSRPSPTQAIDVTRCQIDLQRRQQTLRFVVDGRCPGLDRSKCPLPTFAVNRQPTFARSSRRSERDASGRPLSRSCCSARGPDAGTDGVIGVKTKLTLPRAQRIQQLLHNDKRLPQPQRSAKWRSGISGCARSRR